MARLLVAAAIAVAAFTTGTPSAFADDAERPIELDAVHRAASDAGVDPEDLQGALNALQVAGRDETPEHYLCWTDHLLCPPPPVAVGPPIGIWDRLASCESSGNWSSTSNPKYKGGLQMDSTFWARYGGLAYASAPQFASRAQQIAVAQRGQAVQGWGAWPVCSRVVGLR